MAAAQIWAMSPPAPAWRPGERKSNAITTSPVSKPALHSWSASNGRLCGCSSPSIEAATSGPMAGPRSVRTWAAIWSRKAAEAGEGPPWSTTITGGAVRPAAWIFWRMRSAMIAGITSALARLVVNTLRNGAAGDWSFSRSSRSEEPMAPCGLMKNGRKTKSRSPAASWADIHGLSVAAGVPSRSAGAMRSLCFHETGCTGTPTLAERAAATRRRLSVAAGSREPLSMRAMIMGPRPRDGRLRTKRVYRRGRRPRR